MRSLKPIVGRLRPWRAGQRIAAGLYWESWAGAMSSAMRSASSRGHLGEFARGGADEEQVAGGEGAAEARVGRPITRHEPRSHRAEGRGNTSRIRASRLIRSSRLLADNPRVIAHRLLAWVRMPRVRRVLGPGPCSCWLFCLSLLLLCGGS